MSSLETRVEHRSQPLTPRFLPAAGEENIK
jgi:hypothetical protein